MSAFFYCKKAAEVKTTEIKGDEEKFFSGISFGHAGRDAEFC